MRLITARLDHIYVWDGDDAKKAEQTARLVEKRRDALAKVGVQTDETDLSGSMSVVVTERQLADLMIMGQSIHAQASINVAEDPIMRAAQAIEVAAEKVARFSESLPEVNNNFNERVEVYTPGAGLMLFNRVMLLQDACSDALQSEMDNGWRIIAACPQPDQRRPDYILGRYDPKYALESGANNSALRR